MIEIFIPYIGPSTNTIYAGVHWSKRKKHKAEAAIAVMCARPLPRFERPVTVKATPILPKGQRAYDVSNYSYTYKMIEDALVEHTVLLGDSVKFVTSVELCAPIRGKQLGMKLLITETQT